MSNSSTIFPDFLNPENPEKYYLDLAIYWLLDDITERDNDLLEWRARFVAPELANRCDFCCLINSSCTNKASGACDECRGADPSRENKCKTTLPPPMRPAPDDGAVGPSAYIYAGFTYEGQTSAGPSSTAPDLFTVPIVAGDVEAMLSLRPAAAASTYEGEISAGPSSAAPAPTPMDGASTFIRRAPRKYMKGMTKPPQIVCEPCRLKGRNHYNTCNMDLDQQLGCSNCRKRDEPCTRGPTLFKDRPDGLVKPLCCDQCLADGLFLFSCSWRAVPGEPTGPCGNCVEKKKSCTFAGVEPKNLVEGTHTHLTMTQYLPVPRPCNMIEVHANMTPGSEYTIAPRPEAGSSRDRSRSPAGTPPKGKDTSAATSALIPANRPNAFGLTGKPRCDLCRSLLARRQNQCDATGDTGCEYCRKYATVCIVNGRPLKPKPTAKTARAKFADCKNCKENNRPCDRQRPCDSCTKICEQCAPAGATEGGSWLRGPDSTGMGAYYLSLGYGPKGVDDLQNKQWPYFQPDNYRETFMQMRAAGVRTGPLQGPPDFVSTVYEPGFNSMAAPDAATPDFSIPDDINLSFLAAPRSPPAGEPLAQADHLGVSLVNEGEVGNNETDRKLIADYEKAWDTARFLVAKHGNNIMDLREVRGGLRGAMLARQPAADSFYWQQIHALLVEKSPPPSNPIHERLAINMPADADENLVDWLNPGWRDGIRNAAAEPLRPRSPAPIQPIFHVRGPPLPVPHPNPKARGVMDVVLFYREPVPFLSPRPCTAFRADGRTCGNNAEGSCEDIRHEPGACAICDSCDADSRIRTGATLDGLIMQLRAYACSECAGWDVAMKPDIYHGCGVRVWGIDPQLHCSPAAVNANNELAGSFMGIPLPATGCLCATKLLGRRICQPHRTQDLLDLQTAVREMRNYVERVAGKMVCPWCMLRQGADAFRFRGERGCEGEQKPFVCMACHGVVIGLNDNICGLKGVPDADASWGMSNNGIIAPGGATALHGTFMGPGDAGSSMDVDLDLNDAFDVMMS